MTKRRVIATTASAIGLLALGAGSAVATTAFATSATPERSVYACRSSHGVLSLESHGHCPHGTTKVLIGAPGPKGATGPRGETGAQGPDGDTGATGQQGPDGDTGATGQQGPKGDTGPGGPQGPNGATGATGPQGGIGSTGPAGADGKTIRYGTGAPAPSFGSDGDFYVDTAATILYGPKANSTWPAGSPLIGPAGPQGPAGANGHTIRYGNSAPDKDLGTPGDFYIDTATNTLYGPKGEGGWPAGTSLVGPAGTPPAPDSKVVGLLSLSDGKTTVTKRVYGYSLQIHPHLSVPTIEVSIDLRRDTNSPQLWSWFGSGTQQTPTLAITSPDTAATYYSYTLPPINILELHESDGPGSVETIRFNSTSVQVTGEHTPTPETAIGTLSAGGLENLPVLTASVDFNGSTNPPYYFKIGLLGSDAAWKYFQSEDAATATLTFADGSTYTLKNALPGKTLPVEVTLDDTDDGTPDSAPTISFYLDYSSITETVDGESSCMNVQGMVC
jgi:hypothetical protein